MEGKIKVLRNLYIFHVFVYLLLASSHIIIYLKIFWIKKTSKIIFYVMVYILSFYCVIPIFFSIFFSCSKETKRMIKILHSNFLFFILLGIIFPWLIFLALFDNYYELDNYETFCPFLYNINDIDIIFDNIKNIEQKCQIRRCFINI